MFHKKPHIRPPSAAVTVRSGMYAPSGFISAGITSFKTELIAPNAGPNKIAGSFEKKTDKEILIPPAPANGSIMLAVHFKATVTAINSALSTSF